MGVAWRSTAGLVRRQWPAMQGSLNHSPGLNAAVGVRVGATVWLRLYLDRDVDERHQCLKLSGVEGADSVVQVGGPR